MTSAFLHRAGSVRVHLGSELLNSLGCPIAGSQSVSESVLPAFRPSFSQSVSQLPRLAEIFMRNVSATFFIQTQVSSTFRLLFVSVVMSSDHRPGSARDIGVSFLTASAYLCTVGMSYCFLAECALSDSLIAVMIMSIIVVAGVCGNRPRSRRTDKQIDRQIDGYSRFQLSEDTRSYRSEFKVI